MYKRHTFAAVAAFLIFAFHVETVFSQNIAVALKAEVVDVDDSDNVLGGQIKVGDAVTGSYTYKLGVPDDHPDPKIGTYHYNTAPYGITVNVGPWVFGTDPNNVDFGIEVQNDRGDFGPNDTFNVASNNNIFGISAGVAALNVIHWQLDDNTGQALCNDGLSATPPFLPAWDHQVGIVIESRGDEHRFFIIARVTSAEPVGGPVISPVSIGFTAQIDRVNDEQAFLGGAIQAGDLIKGSYLYNPAAADRECSPFVGSYQHTTAPFGVTVHAGGFTFRTDPNNVRFLIEIDNDFPGDSPSDAYLFSSFNNVFDVEATDPGDPSPADNSISWQLDDSTAHALPGDALPATAPNLADWQSNRFEIRSNHGASFDIQAHVISVATGAVTAEGSNVVVAPVDSTSGTTPVSLTFSNVTGGGSTSLTTSDSGTPPPTGFSLGDPPVYYDVDTTAQFSGPVNVCISYAGVSYVSESQLKLFHFENNAWVDRTVSVDTTNKIVCGSVSSFSAIAVFGVDITATVQPPLNPDGSSTFISGRGVVPLKFTLSVAGTKTCELPPAVLTLTRTAGSSLGLVSPNQYLTPEESGSNFRKAGCQYLYNLRTDSLAPGTYRVDLKIGGATAGNATFKLQ